MEADQNEEPGHATPEGRGTEYQRAGEQSEQSDRCQEHPLLHDQELMRRRAGKGIVLVDHIADTEQQHPFERISKPRRDTATAIRRYAAA